MKKLLTILLSLLMLLAMVGCTSNGGSGEEEGEKTHYNFYTIYKVDGEYFLEEAAGIKMTIQEYADERGFTFDLHYIGCDSDPEKCMTMIDTAIADKADAIFVCPPDQGMSEAIVEKCNEAGVLVVSVDDPLIDGEGKKIAPWFGIDAYNIGYASGTWMANYAIENNLVDDPTCGLLYTTMETVTSCVPRTDGEEAAWADIIGDKMADRTFYSDSIGTQQTLYDTTSAIYAAHPEITKWLILTTSEAVIGAAAALEDAGLDKDACISSLGCSSTYKYWQEGQYLCIKHCSYFSGPKVGQAAATAVMDYLLDGKEMPLEYATPAVDVFPDTWENELLIVDTSIITK
jgi:L-arabinose transport system substrate-binding protein